jgi:hypothetical protein
LGGLFHASGICRIKHFFAVSISPRPDAIGHDDIARLGPFDHAVDRTAMAAFPVVLVIAPFVRRVLARIVIQP